jgi:hypothetical protein
MNPDRHLAASTERRQGRPLDGHGKARSQVIEKRNSGNCRHVVFARLDT